VRAQRRSFARLSAFTARPRGKARFHGQSCLDDLWSFSCAQSSKDKGMVRGFDGSASTWIRMTRCNSSTLGRLREGAEEH